jgi:hypothetical protein
MPRRCTVCDHLERPGIDEVLVSGAPYRSVAKRFGLSESAVYRHKTEHLPAHLLKAREAEEVAQADDLLNQVRNLQAHALHILERGASWRLEDRLGCDLSGTRQLRAPWKPSRGTRRACGHYRLDILRVAGVESCNSRSRRVPPRGTRSGSERL